MPRTARVVVPGLPHHVTQRGARRQQVFFGHDDYALYRKILTRLTQRHALEIWAYCLMPNHIHLIAVPSSAESLARSIGTANQHYAQLVNKREGWSGHLWQERFASFPMDAAHLHAAVRYVLLNPIRSRLVDNPDDWPHSSIATHLRGARDALVNGLRMRRRIDDWQAYLSRKHADSEVQIIRRHTMSGLPLGSDTFVEALERRTGRRLRPGTRGRPRQRKE